jgi:sRNA-binding carbon storage regulator CsrA
MLCLLLRKGKKILIRDKHTKKLYAEIELNSKNNCKNARLTIKAPADVDIIRDELIKDREWTR